MAISKKQRDIIIGIILGDGFIKKTGKRNARLRIEHSIKQKDYIFWKYEQLKNLMQSRPRLVERYNPISKKTYKYYRCQSHSSPIFGKYRRLFYKDSRKAIPDNIDSLLKSPLSLAVWYGDDGCYCPKDKSAWIYLPKYPPEEIEKLRQAILNNFWLNPKIIKKKDCPCFYFTAEETEKLFSIIKQYIPPCIVN